MKSKSISLLLLSLFISACSTTEEKPSAMPEWVNGSSKQYPAALYLTGQGSAFTADDAKDRARSDLAKQFEVAVQERSQQSQAFSSRQANGETQQTLDQNVSRQLLTYTSRTLQGVEIADQWYNPDRELHYALAVLSRNKAQQQFEQKLSALDEESRQRLTQAEAETSPLIKAALVQQAVKAQQQRIVVQNSLQVVDSSGRGKPSNISLAELIRSRDALLKKVHIQPSAKGEMSEALEKLLSGATAGAGFSLAMESEADYQLLIQAQLDPPIEEKDWYWLRGTLQVNLIAPSGDEVGVQRWPLKASSTGIERTQQRLLSDVDNILKNELREVLLGFAVKP